MSCQQHKTIIKKLVAINQNMFVSGSKKWLRGNTESCLVPQRTRILNFFISYLLQSCEILHSQPDFWIPTLAGCFKIDVSSLQHTELDSKTKMSMDWLAVFPQHTELVHKWVWRTKNKPWQRNCFHLCPSQWQNKRQQSCCGIHISEFTNSCPNTIPFLLPPQC